VTVKRDRDSTANRRASESTSPSPSGLAFLLRPTLNDVAGRAHGVVDNARRSAESVVESAGHEARRVAEDAEYRLRRLTTHAAEETKSVLADADQRLARTGERLVERWGAVHEEVANSVMDKILVVVMAGVLAYAAYAFTATQGTGSTNIAGAGRLFWIATTLISLMVWLARSIVRHSDRLTNVLKWQLYVLTLASATAAVLVVMEHLSQLK
jgi:hypothetical protein